MIRVTKLKILLRFRNKRYKAFNGYFYVRLVSMQSVSRRHIFEFYKRED